MRRFKGKIAVSHWVSFYAMIRIKEWKERWVKRRKWSLVKEKERVEKWVEKSSILSFDSNRYDSDSSKESFFITDNRKVCSIHKLGKAKEGMGMQWGTWFATKIHCFYRRKIIFEINSTMDRRCMREYGTVATFSLLKSGILTVSRWTRQELATAEATSQEVIIFK